jgi:hypothetical protein
MCLDYHTVNHDGSILHGGELSCLPPSARTGTYVDHAAADVWGRNTDNGEGAMLAYANVYLGCLALVLEFVAMAPVWPEAAD